MFLSYRLSHLPSSGFGFILLLLAIVLVIVNIYHAKRQVDAVNNRQQTKCHPLQNFHENYTRNLSDKKTKFLSIPLNFFMGLLIGVNLVIWQAFFAPVIDVKAFDQKGWFSGQVVSLPQLQKTAHYTKVSFIYELRSKQQNFDSPLQEWNWRAPKLKLNWYLSESDLSEIGTLPKNGEIWRFYGKLKSNHASLNPGVRDYETWLFQQHLLGKLNVSGLQEMPSGLNAVKVASVPAYSLQQLRSYLAGYLDELYVNSAFAPVYRALLIGDKSRITQSQWELFQTTGTIHLMAISGLHMSIMAAIGFAFAQLLWRLFVYRQMRMTLPLFSALTALLFATLYLLISGAAIPTQRAWIMVATLIVFFMLRRTFQPFAALAMAACLIVFWDSRAVLSSGFWLSFAAVALIFSGLQLAKTMSKRGKLLFIQLLLSIGLLPLIAWHYYEVPVYGVLANLIAVPFMTIIGLPLLLVTMLTGWISEGFATLLISVSDWLWDYLWHYLLWLAQLPLTEYPVVQFSIIWLAVIYLDLGCLFWFAHRQASGVESNTLKSWRFILFLAFYILTVFIGINVFKPAKLNVLDKPGQAMITVMDVGQGQAIVIQTQRHAAIYDAGAKWGATTDAAKIVLLPYLKSQGITKIDLLMISHSDSDHSGGAESLLQELNINQQVSGQPDKLNRMLNRIPGSVTGNSEDKTGNVHFQACHAGQNWLFDGVRFEVLSPNLQNHDDYGDDNDWSCVLQISSGQTKALIMGDLGAREERKLIARNGNENQTLQSELLIAGHHGSRFSTSTAWLQAIQADKVVFSSGYMNRFGFPNAEVLQRIEQTDPNTRWWNTACSGALSFKLDADGVKLINEARKSQLKWYHHRCLPSQQGVFYQ